MRSPPTTWLKAKELTKQGSENRKTILDAYQARWGNLEPRRRKNLQEGHLLWTLGLLDVTEVLRAVE